MAELYGITQDIQPESSGTDRRIPVYLLLDTSGSMEGPGIEALNLGLTHFSRDVAENPIARDSVHVGVITFSSEAQLITGGLVPITAFQPMDLTASGVTRLDLAFQILRESLDRDVARPILHKQRGDGRPIIFVFTDGKPTDSEGNLSNDWKPARDSVVSDQIGGASPKGTVRLYDIIAVGCGTEPDDANLKAISTGLAFKVGKDDIGFSQFIKLVTMVSILSAQRQAGGGIGADQGPAPLIRDEDLPPEMINQRIP